MFRHVQFNCALGISHAMEEAQKDGFALVRIVPLSAYESVAVFEKPDGGPTAAEFDFGALAALRKTTGGY